MMLIRCPWCGPRGAIEFTYGGDATKRRPEDAAAGDEAFHDYIHLRDNPEGPHLELWHHSHGCRMWVKVLRDTKTHAIAATGAPQETLPGEEG